MSLEITGEYKHRLDKQQGEGKNGAWEKQTFVIETSGDYPKKIAFDVWNDKINDLAKFKQGDKLKVYFEIDSREYEGKWYTGAKAWKIEGLNGGVEPSPPLVENTPPPQETDDLPF